MRTLAVACVAVFAALASLVWSGPSRAQGVVISAGYGGYGSYDRHHYDPYYRHRYHSYRSYSRPRFSARIVVGSPSYRYDPYYPRRSYSRYYGRPHYYSRSYSTSYGYRAYRRPYRNYDCDNAVSYRW